MKLLRPTFVFALVLFGLCGSPIKSVYAQTGIPPVMDSATFEDQMEYLHEKTRIYNGFRAIRDDIFLKMKENALDSLAREKLEVARLKSEMSERDFQIESLNSDLVRARNERDEAIRTKDGFSFLGIQMQKGLYNTVMWIIVVGLASLAVMLFLLFKRSHLVTVQTRKELENIQEAFEEHRKSSREKYEKLVVSHHSEIMKLKRS